LIFLITNLKSTCRKPLKSEISLFITNYLFIIHFVETDSSLNYSDVNEEHGKNVFKINL